MTPLSGPVSPSFPHGWVLTAWSWPGYLCCDSMSTAALAAIFPAVFFLFFLHVATCSLYFLHSPLLCMRGLLSLHVRLFPALSPLVTWLWFGNLTKHLNPGCLETNCFETNLSYWHVRRISEFLHSSLALMPPATFLAEDFLSHCGVLWWEPKLLAEMNRGGAASAQVPMFEFPGHCYVILSGKSFTQLSSVRTYRVSSEEKPHRKQKTFEP